jgi:aminopeptidase
MGDPRVAKLADILVGYSTNVRKGDVVMIDFSGFRPLPLVEAVFERCLKAGAVAVEYNYADDELTRIFYERARGGQLRYFPKHRLQAMKAATVYIGIGGAENTQYLAGAPMPSLVERQKVLRPIINRRVDFTRWVVTRYPTQGLAQDARMSLQEFEELYFGACNIDWPSFARRIDRLWRLLSRAKTVRIKASDTDLSFSVKGIPAVKSEGLRNMPDGEVFTAPVKDSVEGHITYNIPSLYQGKEFDGVRFEFKKGRIVEATARAGSGKELRKILDADKGARYIGEFSFGLNKGIRRPMKNILFDEKIAGSIHFTPGQAYKVADNGNRSSVHWDLVKVLKGDGEVYVDGRLVQKDGLFITPDLKALN